MPRSDRTAFLGWIDENRDLRESHGILFELVLQRSGRQNPAKTLRPADPDQNTDEQLIVVTAWASHEAFDTWIDTPERDRLTASDVHGSVRYGPITRYDVAVGYLNVDGLSAVTDSVKEEP